MPFPPHRRHRKTSPVPSTRRASTARSGSSSAHDDGEHLGNSTSRSFLSNVRAYVVSARDRISERSRALSVTGDTLLPTTFNSAPSPSKFKAAGPTRSVNCNSFLMGGQFYPGKDKKRRHLRRRTCWYRVFFSSPIRVTITVLFSIYVITYHVLVPTVDYILDVGKALTRERYHKRDVNWLHHEQDLSIPSLLEEQTEAIKLAAARAESRLHDEQNGLNGKQKMAAILEAIIPSWFHRNDDTPNRNQEQHNESTKDESQPRRKLGLEYNYTNVSVVDGKATMGKRTLSSIGSDGKQHRHACHEKGGSYDDVRTTLVLQTTLDRLWILKETCSRWHDPIVVVVFVPFSESAFQQNEIHEFVPKADCPQMHLVHYQATMEESSANSYPVNRLRNTGLELVSTSHVLVMDIDLVPSLGLAEQIKGTIWSSRNGTISSDLNTKSALVVPAFEKNLPTPCATDEECAQYLKSDSSFIPNSFHELKACVDTRDCSVFQSSTNWEGHSSTKSKDWLSGEWFSDIDGVRLLRIVKCFHTARYEPYVVLPWCPSDGQEIDTPYYDERFHGYGKNKIQLVSHLRVLGFQFYVLPRGFTVHNPHVDSQTKQVWNDIEGSKLHASMDKLYSLFLKELQEKYKGADVRNMVPICDRDLQ